MIKHYAFIAASIFCLTPAFAQTPQDWQTALDQTVRQNSRFAAQPKVQMLSWEEFGKVAVKAAQKNTQTLAAQAKLFNANFRALTPVQKEDFKQGVAQAAVHSPAPDYASLLAKAKFVYIGEEHYSPSTRREVQTIITQYRKQHPQARVLLASEFITRKSQKTDGLQKGLSMYKPEIYQYGEYAPLFSAMHTLGVDTLALEDTLIDRQDNNYVASFNNYRITLLTAQEVQEKGRQLAAENPDVAPEQLTAEFQAFVLNTISDRWHAVAASDWGVEQRNRVWAAKLAEAEKDYDVIFVYAGNAHTALGLPTDLPLLVKRPYTELLLIKPQSDTNKSPAAQNTQEIDVWACQMAPSSQEQRELEQAYDFSGEIAKNPHHVWVVPTAKQERKLFTRYPGSPNVLGSFMVLPAVK